MRWSFKSLISPNCLISLVVMMLERAGCPLYNEKKFKFNKIARSYAGLVLRGIPHMRYLAITTLLAVAVSLLGNPVFAEVPVQPQSEIERQDAVDSVKPAKLPNRPRVGLALGGGGSRGAAHVGVLKVLKEENIPIDIIAGTSIGSVVGGFYASGMPLDKISEVFEKNIFTKEFAPMPVLRLALEPTALMLRVFGYRPFDGLYYGRKFKNYADKAVGSKRIEQFNIPYAAVVTDVVTGKSCRLTEGDLGAALVASTAVPELRKPMQIGDRLYCDGGVVNNVPVDHARDMGADIVIAVNIDERLKDRPIDDFRALGSMARQALRIQLATFDEPSSKKADVLIHPDTTGISLVSFHKADGKRGIEAGVAAAREAMPEIKRKLAALGIATSKPVDPVK
ncbi:MAG: patatin-like phospholipase family protein [Cyanobacteria bacterium]|nr:patatin-like phospholipase family protein [Cyanobacteriota bacterium]